MTRLDHLTLSVADHRASRDWYTGHLGLTVEFEIPARRAVAVRDDADFTIFLDESHPGGLEGPAGPSGPVSPAGPAGSTGARGGAGSCVLYFQVDSVDAKYQELRVRGVE